MRRTALLVKPACRQDLPALLSLFEEMRETLRSHPGRTPEQLRARAEERYVAAMADPEARLFVVTDAHDGGVLGLAFLTLTPLSSLVDTTCVTMVQMHVARGARRRGAGQALVAAAAQWAEECGAETVTVSVGPQARDSARFYARLGFAPVTVKRVAPVAVLRRRLSPEAVAPTLSTLGETRGGGDRRGMRARLVTARAHASARRSA